MACFQDKVRFLTVLIRCSFLQGYTQFGANDSDVSVTTVKSSSLDMIEELLLRGERRKALQCAMDDKLWAHAMVIASSVDKDAWKDVVNDFLRSEFPVNQHHGATANGSAQPSGFKGRESLRVAYSLFSGQGAAAGAHPFSFHLWRPI